MGFFALGTWQVKRLSWKLDLIQRVNQRVHAPAVNVPDPASWPQISAKSDEYRHVRASGTFLYTFSTYVQASTDYGSGFWLLTPLRMADGSSVLINRGFVSERAKATTHALDKGGTDHIVTVTGLLRISEPGGAFLRSNDPAADRWYSRDVQAIAAAHHLTRVAPYFIDVDASGAHPTTINRIPADQPVGGLTVIAFHNSHLVYALTWYALALMVAGAFFWLVHEERSRSDDE